MYIPKRYGHSRRDMCPFCSRQGTTVNSQKIPVCIDHKNSLLGDMKCVCGSYIDLMNGKFGVFFNCIKCGAISMSKALEFNKVVDVNKKKSEKPEFRKAEHPKGEIQIRSDDARYF